MDNISITNINGDPVNYLYQWDANQKVIITGLNVAGEVNVHFCNIDSEFALITRAEVTADSISAEVPNILLQKPKPVVLYVYNTNASTGERTVYMSRITIIPRPRPADYIYTETETLHYSALDERILALEKALENSADKTSSGLHVGPEPPEDPNAGLWLDTDEESGDMPEQETGNDGFSPIVNVTETDTGAVISITDKDGTTEVTITNGKDGADGQPGKDGYTPQKGVDYFDGQPGKDGVDGKDGSPGADGYTPVKGKDYKDGADGVSPTVAVSAITGGHHITITDKSGTKTVDVMDGEDGDPGRGIKAIARTSGNGAAGTTDTYTITYTDSTTSTFTVRNGSNGAAGTAATLEITEVTALEHGAAPTVTEQSGSTAQARKYILGIPAGKPGADGADAETVPDYVIAEAEAVARIINQHQSGDSFVIPVLTDAHCGYYTDKTNAATKLAGQLLYQIGKRAPFDCIANCGDAANGAWDTTRDMTYEQYEDYTELTAEAHRGVPAVWAPGNHDDAPYMATADRATQRDMFALIGRKNRLSGSVCPNGCCYGYLDLENRKLRVIYLDTDDKRSWGTVQVGSGGTAPAYLNAHNVGGVQLRWLAETALDFGGKANPAEWSIVVVSHVALDVSGTITDAVSGASYAHSTANAATLLNAYRLGKSGSIDHNGVTVNYDFSAVESRAVVICAVHGHNHKFCSETLDGGIVSIGCPNAMNGRERVSDDGNTYAKTAGTADGTSFCIITIDRENCMIYADCVGAGYDREFEYTTEVVSYTNQLPISTDASGNIYNGKGWKENTYLSGGNDGAKNGTFATGFIPVASAVNEFGTAYFYLKNVGMTNNQDGHRLCTYKADKTNITTYKTTIQGNPFMEYGSDGNISVIALPANVISTGVAYIRLCCGYLGEDSIITSNEPIQ